MTEQTAVPLLDATTELCIGALRDAAMDYRAARQANRPARCRLCTHSESEHVPFPTCGDLGWYGCVECSRLGTERCRFFVPATSEEASST